MPAMPAANGMAALQFQDPAILAAGSGMPPPADGPCSLPPALAALATNGSALPAPIAPQATNGAAAVQRSNGGAPGKANPHSRTSSTTRAHLTEVTFASLPISANSKRAVAEVLRYETCTAVQAQTLPLALQGTDLIAKAKTGTGKTIGFLLPTIERIAQAKAKATPGILALVISPTRECAPPPPRPRTPVAPSPLCPCKREASPHPPRAPVAPTTPAALAPGWRARSSRSATS